MSYADEVYKPRLEEAAEYQDFLTVQLLRYGIVLNIFSSKKYQYDKGESASGIEIKHDCRLQETGNVFIEVSERSSPDVKSFTPSGIFRNDGTWLYFIGDYERGLLLHKGQMRDLLGNKDKCKTAGLREIENGTKTARGFVIEYERLKNSKYCLKSFNFNEQTE